MITVRTSPAYVNRVRQDWTANGGVYGDGGISAIVPSNDPFAQLGATLDLTFAGVPTNQLTAATTDGYSINLNLSSDIYQIAAQYVVWQSGVGMASVNFSDIVTFTRASTATYFNSAGTLTTAAINEARFDYNPSTLAAQGLLIEEQRTNGIRNNTSQGAVAGTPGTVPTNWVTNYPIDSLTRTIVGVGSENGISYVDIKIAGTATATRSQIELFLFELAGQIASVSGQINTASVYVKLVGGSVANVTFQTQIQDYSSVPALLGENGTAFVPTSAALSSQRVLHTRTSIASTASVRPGISLNYSSGAVIDFTLRIGLPQLEQGAFATSVIPTTTTALTRSADVASVNTLSPWFNATEGTLYAEWTRGYTGNFSNFVSPAIITNNLSGASSNSISSVVTNGANQQLYNSMVANNVEQLDYRARNAQTTNKGALAYKTNDTQQFINGLAEIADTSCTVPTSVSQMNIGAGAVTNAFINSWIRRITYYPRRLSQADGITITA